MLDHLSLPGDTEQVLDEPFYPVGRLLDHLDVFLTAGPLVLIQVVAEDVERISEVIAEDALVSAVGSAHQRDLISPELWAEAPELLRCSGSLRTTSSYFSRTRSSMVTALRSPIPIDSGFVLRIGPTQVVDRIIVHRRDRQVSRGEHASNQRFSLADRRVVVLVGKGIDITGDIYENSVDDTQDIIDQGADLICF